MSKPIPDKAEVAFEFPDKLYVGTFERSARFDTHFDSNGVSLTLERSQGGDDRRSVHMHLHHGLFADILADLAATVAAIPREDVAHRAALHHAITVLGGALDAQDDPDDASRLSPDEEVMLLRLME